MIHTNVIVFFKLEDVHCGQGPAMQSHWQENGTNKVALIWEGMDRLHTLIHIIISP